MNQIIERVMNSEKLGARIIRNGALDPKRWALDAFRGKKVFSRGSKEMLEFFWSGWRVFGAKDRALVEFGKFSGIFLFLEGLE
jgi:hypothetical protein